MTRKRLLSLVVALSVTGIVVFGWIMTPRSSPTAQAAEAAMYAEVERVYNGTRVRLDSGEKLVYAGIRGLSDKEPLCIEATARNIKFVEGEDVRLRFDEQREDAKGNLLAYVIADCGMVNEELVREGLAYVRVTPLHKRFADRLLAAQEEAIVAKRGVWSESRPARVKGGFHADPKYGNFHLSSCAERSKMKEERRVSFKKRLDAVRAGYAPCAQCKP